MGSASRKPDKQDREPGLNLIWQDLWFESWFKRKEEVLHERFIEYAWVLRNLNLERGSVLDVGCGGSFWPLLLALQGLDVTAIDTHPFDYGFSYYAFMQANGAKVRFDRKFDRITLISSLEHFGIQQGGDMDIDKKTIRNLRRYLNPGGLFLVTVPFFGKPRVLASWRVYDKERLSEIFPSIIKQEFFRREGKFWHKVGREELENLKHFKARSAIVCLVAR